MLNWINNAWDATVSWTTGAASTTADATVIATEYVLEKSLPIATDVGSATVDASVAAADWSWDAVKTTTNVVVDGTVWSAQTISEQCTNVEAAGYAACSTAVETTMWCAMNWEECKPMIERSAQVATEVGGFVMLLFL